MRSDYHQRIKTYQKKLGVRRTLAATKCDSRRVQTIARWIDATGWRPSSGESRPSRNIAGRVNRTLHEIALGDGIDSSLIPTHSLWVGRSTTLYDAGIGPVDIQRGDAG